MTKESKPGRKRTGTVVKTRDGRLQAIVTLVDGSRKRLRPFDKGTSEAMARERAQHWQERVDREGIRRAPKPKAEPQLCAVASDNSDWFDAWIADRKARGQTSVRDSAGHYRHHILKCLGPKHIKDWTRDDMRKLSRTLDGKVQAGTISWKTAWNIWGTATRMCSDAAESKLDAVRVREDNPTKGVRGPDRGDDVGKQYLYPSEYTQFMSCADVPLVWKRLVTVAIYLYPRDGELRALHGTEVDTQHQIVTIAQALERRSKAIKATKGKRYRPVRIEPELMPLLAQLKAEAGDGLLFPKMPSERDMARGLRRYLKKAGVTRRSLFEKTPTTRPLRWHDLRATGITWMAVRGDDPLKIQQRAGHADFATTQEYVRIAGEVREGFGEVFPPLDLHALGVPTATDEDPKRSRETITRTQVREIWRSGRDSNPRPPA